MAGFNNDKYIELQSMKIKERIDSFNDRLYLEFGGKLFDDYHASRVLPGFKPDTKLQMLLTLKQDLEIILVINSTDIINNKSRSDLHISYNDDVLRLIDAFRAVELDVAGVIVTQYIDSEVVNKFIDKLKNQNINVKLNYTIEGYPNDVKKIVSEEGLGKNEYLEVNKKLIVLTAPGPGSGKMATCLSQMYHDNLRGINAGYAKFETFPVHNLSLTNLVNVAYEAATIDLNDVNMIDPFHLESYNIKSINYNRDIEVFPVLNRLLTNILGDNPYKSPTDMGVNMAGFCIDDEASVNKACINEIIRRYYKLLVDHKKGIIPYNVIEKMDFLMANNQIDKEERKCIDIANQVSLEEDIKSVVTISISDEKTIIGKNKQLLGASSACVLNALKELANIDEDALLISPEVLEPIQNLKLSVLGNSNPRLHLDETLIALSISALTDELSKKAYDEIKNLHGLEAHSTVILSEVDLNVFRKLGINITEEPVYLTKKLYHK